MNAMTHREYAARIEYSDEDGCFVGHIAGIDDIVGFHAVSVAELRRAFEDAVDDYIQTCEKLNRHPQQPYFDDITLRLPPQVHTGIAAAAEVSGKSVDQWAAEALAEALNARP